MARHKRELQPQASVTRQILDDAVDRILEGVQNMFEEQQKILNQHTHTLDQHSHILDRLDHRLTDLSLNTPTLAEHKKLAKRVSRLERSTFLV
ncbi:MAG: hypothetical protein HY381_00640 [Candidatus Chisholmbacteria bacterium]|nr:hypothetical protein [Candidatus Chisholmbacteria bacterium]